MRIIKVLLAFCLVSCGSTSFPTYDVKFSGNTIQVPVIGFDESTFNIVNDDTAPFDILLVKQSPLAYNAIYLKCTFDAKPLDVATELLVCPVCNSTFDFDGTPKSGQAESSLARFPTELTPDQTLVTINIEALGR